MDIVNVSILMQNLDSKGTIVWIHDGIVYNCEGALQQVVTNSLWKQHGYPYAEVWLHRMDGGYDFVGPAYHFDGESFDCAPSA